MKRLDERMFIGVENNYDCDLDDAETEVLHACGAFHEESVNE